MYIGHKLAPPVLTDPFTSDTVINGHDRLPPFYASYRCQPPFPRGSFVITSRIREPARLKNGNRFESQGRTKEWQTHTCRRTSCRILSWQKDSLF